MLSSTKRRISLLERSIQLPMTAERFAALVEERMRFTGMSVEEASKSVIGSLSLENLDRIEKELSQRVFDNDLQASDERWNDEETQPAASEA
jgi:hypothetical protein